MYADLPGSVSHPGECFSFADGERVECAIAIARHLAVQICVGVRQVFMFYVTRRPRPFMP